MLKYKLNCSINGGDLIDKLFRAVYEFDKYKIKIMPLNETPEKRDIFLKKYLGITLFRRNFRYENKKIKDSEDKIKSFKIENFSWKNNKSDLWWSAEVIIDVDKDYEEISFLLYPDSGLTYSLFKEKPSRKMFLGSKKEKKIKPSLDQIVNKLNCL